MPDAKDILAGDILSGARLIRLIEERDPCARKILADIRPHTGKAFIIGMTGSPGVGKSTLVSALITEFRKLERRVAVIAVDPSSPVSGGAFLGDRLRMQRHAADKHVFIRSMASRGQKGGLSRATVDAAHVLDAMGYGIIIIETAGAGQTEVDVSEFAHSVGIVTIPGAGDGIQAIKAGILETGDVYIVNKCDRPEAEAAVFELNMMLDAGRRSPDLWKPVVIETRALDGYGVRSVAEAFLSHFDFLNQKGRLAEKKKALNAKYFEALLRDLVMEKAMAAVKGTRAYHQAEEDVRAGKKDPVAAAEDMAGRTTINDTLSP